MRQRTLGLTGEDLAADYLQQLGMSIVERNFRCPRGEIDIIAMDGETVVFVEVKTRRTAVLGSPLEAVTPAKLRKIRLVAGIWLGLQSGFSPALRIDAIGIVMESVPDITHLKNVQADW